jgi:hypothetical protein
MKTDVIVVSNKGERMEAALNQAEKVAAYKGLSPKNALHLRLLTEELMGMMRSITGETQGKFWIEDEEDVYELHLLVSTRMNSEKREQLLAASSSGKNESAKGLMGRLRDFFDRGADEDIAGYTTPLLMHGAQADSTTPTLDWEWSMIRYQDALADCVRRDDSAAREAWDELEKSVVAHVADDVKVSIKGGKAEMIIVKKMA